MQTISINKDNAQKAYKKASSETKEILEILLGKENINGIRDGKITDRIKTFEDACLELGVDVDSIIPALTGQSRDAMSIIAYCKLIVIIRALNEGWEPDWTDSDQSKYRPWFDLSSGSGLSYGDCGNGRSGSPVGSRLVFKSQELCEYASQQFNQLYKEFFLMEK